MAVFMTFAFMSVSLTYVSAENETPAGQSEQKEETPKAGEETPNAEDDTPAAPTAPTPSIAFSNNTYGAPDVEVTIDFGNLEPEIDYNTAAKNPTSQDISVVEILSKILSNIKVYKTREAQKYRSG